MRMKTSEALRTALKEVDTNRLTKILELACIPDDQDYENESTTWKFDDGSTITINSSSEVTVA
jgi:hypothetical protein